MFLSVSTCLPMSSSEKHPIIFVHGAGTTSGVWVYWQRRLTAEGWPTYNMDLRGHGDSEAIDLTHTSMWDYVEDVNSVARQLSGDPVLIGWSMGGHIAILAASLGGYSACVTLDPDPPVSHFDDSIELIPGEYTPEEVGYDLMGDPDNLPGMPDLTTEERSLAQQWLTKESRVVGQERSRGILVKAVPCPVLEIVGGYNNYYPTEPSYYSTGIADRQIYVQEASHWGLMLNKRIVPWLLDEVVGWLDTKGCNT